MDELHAAVPTSKPGIYLKPIYAVRAPLADFDYTEASDEVTAFFKELLSRSAQWVLELCARHRRHH
ncbi:hypothetical protein [Aestuariivirga sp.]|uniref:hypothetical protein n=1 Tax=Aestuariivirga sp. TaxID=2650926 RepID=UPI0039E4C20B